MISCLLCEEIDIPKKLQRKILIIEFFCCCFNVYRENDEFNMDYQNVRVSKGMSGMFNKDSIANNFVK